MNHSTGALIRKLREEAELPLRKVAAQLDIDTSYLSKIERNQRRASREQIIQLAQIFNIDKNYLLIPFLSEFICSQILNENCAHEVLKAALKELNHNAHNKNNND